jgi:cytochrome bd ubiquinol oxidase subunit II
MAPVETLWFVLVAGMLVLYVVLDGFDLGAGAIHPWVARTNDERKLVYHAIGPVWDGNEVWLIAAGGTLLFTFPRLYAASLSGFYLPLMVVLWLLVLRGLAVELRSRGNEVWMGLWDGLFFLASGSLAFFFGVAAANVVRGVPLDAQGFFFEPLWTDVLDPRSPVPGVLDWYTVLIGLLALSALVMHGANFIAMKTEDPLNRRARHSARWALLVTVALTVVSTIATFVFVRPTLLDSFRARPWGYVFPAIAIAALIAVGVFNVLGRDRWSLLASGAYLAGMLASSAFALYPDVLPATNPANSLTVTNAAAPMYGLVVGLVWWTIGIGLALIYFVVIYRLFSGKVRLADEGY